MLERNWSVQVLTLVGMLGFLSGVSRYLSYSLRENHTTVISVCHANLFFLTVLCLKGTRNCFWHFFFILLYVYWPFDCINISVAHVCLVLEEDSGDHRIPWNWSSSGLWADMSAPGKQRQVLWRSSQSYFTAKPFLQSSIKEVLNNIKQLKKKRASCRCHRELISKLNS